MISLSILDITSIGIELLNGCSLTNRGTFSYWSQFCYLQAIVCQFQKHVWLSSVVAESYVSQTSASICPRPSPNLASTPRLPLRRPWLTLGCHMTPWLRICWRERSLEWGPSCIRRGVKHWRISSYKKIRSCICRKSSSPTCCPIRQAFWEVPRHWSTSQTWLMPRWRQAFWINCLERY